jgi:hypothetical protein
MNAVSRRKIEMGTRALEFSRAHPDTDAGYQAAAVRLEQLVARATTIAAAQRDGLIDTRAASARKQELRRQMLAVPIAHLAEVGRAAARDEHELGKTFAFRPSASTYLAFRTAAAGMAAAAQSHKDVLIRHGLAESVLQELVQLLDQFDAALKLGNDGRTAHAGATQDLSAVATEIGRTVRVMDGRNRQRFRDDAQLLGSWRSASTVLGSPRIVPTPTTPKDGVTSAKDGSTPGNTQSNTPEAGDVRPAA